MRQDERAILRHWTVLGEVGETDTSFSPIVWMASGNTYCA